MGYIVKKKYKDHALLINEEEALYTPKLLDFNLRLKTVVWECLLGFTF